MNKVIQYYLWGCGGEAPAGLFLKVTWWVDGIFPFNMLPLFIFECAPLLVPIKIGFYKKDSTKNLNKHLVEDVIIYLCIVKTLN